ncbi:nucleoside monophosphate kinase [Candidatus Saccharibacteria bacterium]|nr:nucleoside monophosphate kinase [Candidatus Saccharibacteria bacterium]
MDEKIKSIIDWIGTGSVNIFGLPFSGKDTLGVQLAEAINGKFLSSGLILRAYNTQDKELYGEMSRGMLVPSNRFYEIILPYFAREDLADFPLILSSVGRWRGEEFEVIEAAESSRHPIRAVILLNLSEAEARRRWEASKVLADRGERTDDKSLEVIEQRINEFRKKTMPVIETYQEKGLLVPVSAHGTREEVFNNAVTKLAEFARRAGTKPEHEVRLEEEV